MTSGGRGQILTAEEMDNLYSARPQRYTDSIRHSLNLAVNELPWCTTRDLGQ